MREALTLEARGFDEDQMPIGAVATLGDDILAGAYWRYDARGLLDHPEAVVLRRAEKEHDLRERRRDVALYTTLEPCLLCMATAMSFFAGRVVYALEAPNDGAADVADAWRPDLGHPPAAFAPYGLPAVTGGVLRDESLDLMTAYVERHPAVPYARAVLPGFSY